MASTNPFEPKLPSSNAPRLVVRNAQSTSVYPSASPVIPATPASSPLPPALPDGETSPIGVPPGLSAAQLAFGELRDPPEVEELIRARLEGRKMEGGPFEVGWRDERRRFEVRKKVVAESEATVRLQDTEEGRASATEIFPKEDVPTADEAAEKIANDTTQQETSTKEADTPLVDSLQAVTLEDDKAQQKKAVADGESPA